MNLRGTHIPFWLLAAAYAAAFLLPALLAEGVFLDGEVYANLARNLAAGQGDLWHPHLSATVHPSWHEHPPLVLWLMAPGYLVFGDHLWIERVYSLLTFAACAGLLVAIWRRLHRDDPTLARCGWLPLAMWLLNPQVPWSYANAMLENTMAIFILGAVYCVVRARERDGIAWGWLATAGAAVFLAVLAKGPVGLFPLAAPGLAFLATGRPRFAPAAAGTLIMLVVLAVGGALLWTWPAAREGLSRYYEQQVVATLGGSRGGDKNVFDFAVTLGEALLPALGLVVVLAAAAWRRIGRAVAAGPHLRTALWFLLLGLAGTLPLGLSPRQSLFYGVPAFPYLALALALAAAPAARSSVERLEPDGRGIRAWRIVTVTLLLLVVAWSATHLGAYNRDPRLRSDVKLMVAHLESLVAPDPGPERVVTVCQNLMKNWALHSALQRYGRIAPDRKGGHVFLVSRGECAEPPLEGWTQVPLATIEFHLYRRDVSSP
ncbi:MAG: phospholipid carrier-dependent glycosyltransferase [bacterium]|nr:phospholipid carrier-dependent glycosyltransferase [bacterium]